MRQTSKRCPAEKRVPRPVDAASHAYGELDLGLAVSIYCAESGSPLLPEGAAGPPPESGANVTEH